MPNAATYPTRPDDQDAVLARDALARITDFLQRHPGSDHDPVEVTVADDGETLTVPRSVVDLVARVLAHMAQGQGVSIVPAHAELTTQQAAEILNVSRPFLIGLLDSEQIDYRLVGTHRRIKASSLLKYQRKEDARARAAADELTALGQEMGLD
jgi:excisionase family DNA binding protein